MKIDMIILRKDMDLVQNYCTKIMAVLNKHSSPNASLLVEDADCLMLTTRSSTALKAYGIDTIKKLISNTERDLMKLPNFGAKSRKEIIQKLAEVGLKLKD